MKFFNRRMLASTAIIGALAIPGAALAQLDDEIIVTAQKRESTLQDTPIAMSAVGGETLADSSIRNAQDLVALVPSLAIPQFANPSATTISIRGIGTSGFNAGLEPSVGVFIDGVYRSRAGTAINDFIAVERIEVLRGPQSTLYGKNTPAGVLSIITKKPYFDFGSEGELTYGNYNQIVAKGSVTGPLGSGEKAAFRVSGNLNKRDGFITNTFTGQDINNRNRYGVRGQLLFEPSDVLSVRLIADYNNINERCCGATPILHAAGPAAALLNLGGPLTNPLPSGTPNLVGTDPFDRQVSYNGNVLTQNDNYGFSGEINFDMGGATLTSITAYRGFDETSNIDADFIDADLVENRRVDDDFKTFTQEFRLTSNGSGQIDWMVGAYYYNQNLNTRNRTTFGADARQYADNLANLLSFQQSGGTAFANLTSVENLFLLAQAIGVDTNEGQMFPHAPITPGTFFRQGDGLGFNFNQKSKSYSAFGSVDWHTTDRMTVTTGLRYTRETKDVIGLFTTDDVFSSLNLNNLAFLENPLFQATTAALLGTTFAANQFAGFAALQPFRATADFTDTRTEDKVTGNVIVAYNWSDTFDTYISYSRGYKAGGFNLSQDTSVTGRDFASETMNNYELGWKAKMFDNHVQFNGAVFSQTLIDFQSNTFNGISFDLTNAGSVSIDGIEIDILAQPTAYLTFTFGTTYLDAKYDEFLQGPAIIGSPTPTVDLSGGRLAGVSKWTISSTATYDFPIGQNLGFIRGEYYYRSGFAPGTDLNVLKEQPGTTILSASVGMRADSWDLSLWGKNLTDAQVFQGVFDTVFQAGSLSGYPIDPATYGVTLRMRH
ncbi:MAG: TonB-dependent receptor [Robiginitomaculum sp.]|nr:TonB-dependent receptor [Robiginitomaculum sp.]